MPAPFHRGERVRLTARYVEARMRPHTATVCTDMRPEYERRRRGRSIQDCEAKRARLTREGTVVSCNASDALVMWDGLRSKDSVPVGALERVHGEN